MSHALAFLSGMDIDAKVAALTALQYGVVARRQLRDLGCTRRQLDHRLATGRWIRHSSRVFGIAGSPDSPEQQLMIAILHAGATALASHDSAAWLWRLPGFTATDVVARSRSHGDPAALGHRPRLLLPHHRTVVRGIPVTTLPRTIYDLAAVLPLGRLARLVDTIDGRSPAILPLLHRMLPEMSARGRTGMTNMRVLLAERPPGDKVRPTGLERRFEQLMENAGYRGFERQVDVGGHSWLGRVDYLWADVGLIVEVDSDLHHASLIDRLHDAERVRGMLAAGYAKVVRATEENLWYRPWMVVEEVGGALRELGALAA